MEDQTKKIDTNKLTPQQSYKFHKAIGNLKNHVRYDDSYHPDLFIYYAVQGYSTKATAAEIGVHRGTIYEWRDKHELFKVAFDIAYTQRQAYYDNLLRENLKDPNFQFLPFIANYKRLFRCSDNSTVHLPEEFKNANNKERSELVIKSLVSENIDLSQAETLMSILKNNELLEIDEVKERLILIEKKMESNK